MIDGLTTETTLAVAGVLGLVAGIGILWARLIKVQDRSSEQAMAFVEKSTEWQRTLADALRTIETLPRQWEASLQRIEQTTQACQLNVRDKLRRD